MWEKLVNVQKKGKKIKWGINKFRILIWRELPGNKYMSKGKGSIYNSYTIRLMEFMSSWDKE